MVRAANERTPMFYASCTAWIISTILLVWLDLGVIAFCGSIFIAIWVFGLRDKFSNEETASAYSVFNTDGRAIVGGFTASQLDRQLRGGGAAGAITRTTNAADNNATDDPVRGPVATAEIAKYTTTTSSSSNNNERLHRRKAAVAAAEQRILQQHQQQQQQQQQQ